MDTAPSPRNSQWRKSSYSGNTGGDCVEVALTGAAAIPVRDSKNPAGPVVTVGAPAWQAFLGSLR
ncbi:uncharacterized protein DUF397 [Streptomyces sp. T12]|uniref:DUF397 domain-containing protein n=1 Tax=Streptomyces sp. T12 TaxID=477697 RepID=UPI0011A25D6E|nr:DUF397 domain-containing protein [Streptomyces sp. T12]TWD27406.1 uncharacterized protein DUF397 [Streptomyces sp. T12]